MLALSTVFIVGCNKTTVNNETENDVIEEINTDSHGGLGETYTQVTVVFKKRVNGILQLRAYSDGDIMGSKEIQVWDESIVSHEYDKFYTKIEVSFENNKR